MWAQCRSLKHCWLCRDKAKGGQFRKSMAAFLKLADADFACPEALNWGGGEGPPITQAQTDVETVVATRHNICLKCDEYDQISGKCTMPDKKCRCCPLKKW
jgi:hypothetical protein